MYVYIWVYLLSLSENLDAVRDDLSAKDSISAVVNLAGLSFPLGLIFFFSRLLCVASFSVSGAVLDG